MAGEGAGAACSEAAELLAAPGDGLASRSEARLAVPLLLSLAGLTASLGAAVSGRCDADRSTADGVALGGGGAITGMRESVLVDARCSSAGTLGRAT